MNDNMYKPKGHFTLLSFDKDGNLLDKYEDPNMIMDSARSVMADNIGILTNRKGIDKIVLGTEGHKTGDILTPKDATDGFISSRTELFSEESVGFTYPITFDVPGTDGPCANIVEADTGSTVDFVKSGTEITYTFNIADTAANDTGSVIFTEAAMYAGTDIFSMKTFKAKIKDNSVLIRIIWKVTF